MNVYHNQSSEILKLWSLSGTLFERRERILSRSPASESLRSSHALRAIDPNERSESPFASARETVIKLRYLLPRLSIMASLS